MQLTTPLYLATLFLAGLILLGLAIYGWFHRATPAAMPFVWGVAADCAWITMSLLGLLSRDPQTVAFWHKAGYIAVANVPLAWLTFTLVYTNRERWLTLRNLLALAVVPVLMVVLVWTNAWHHWFWQTEQIVVRDGLVVSQVVFGPGGWLSILYTQGLMLFDIGLIAFTMFRASRLYRLQTIWVLAGFLVPLAANAIYVFRLGPEQDLTTASFAVSGVLLAVGVFWSHFLDLVPVARDKVVEVLADAVIVLDRRNRIVDLNPTAQRLLGVTSAQAVGKPADVCFQAWPVLAEGLRALPSARRDLVSGQKPDDATFELRDLPLADHRGHVTGRLLVLHDITERRNAELRVQQLNAELEQRVQDRTRELESMVGQLRREAEERQRAAAALRESETRYRALVETSPDAIVVTDPGGQVLMANPKALTLFGFSGDDRPHGESFFDFIAPHDHERARADLQAILQTRRHGAAEYACRRQDGSEFAAGVSVSMVENGASQLQGFISVIRDVTEQRQAEALLRRQHATVELLNHAGRAFSSSLELDEVLSSVLDEVRRSLDSIACSIWLTDLATGEAVCHLATGPQNELVRGWRLPKGQGIVGWVIEHGESLNLSNVQTDLRHYPGVDEITQLQLRSLMAVPLHGRQGTVGVIEVANLRVGNFDAEDLTFLEWLALSAVSAIENAALYAQAQHEIAQRKQAEETLSLANQRLHALSRQLVEVQEAERRQLALELHDELGQMLNSIKLSLDLVPVEEATEAQEPLRRAQRLISRLIQQVRQLALDLRPAMLDDLGLIPALKSLFRRQTSQTGLQVNFENGVPDSHRFHPSIETAAYRIVQEGVTNAARHAGVGLINVVLQADAMTMRLTVRDQGKGFDPAALPAELASTGLAGMRERARLLGGDLDVDSAPGAGTCLRATLPLS